MKIIDDSYKSVRICVLCEHTEPNFVLKSGRLKILKEGGREGGRLSRRLFILSSVGVAWFKESAQNIDGEISIDDLISIQPYSDEIANAFMLETKTRKVIFAASEPFERAMWVTDIHVCKEDRLATRHTP